MKSYTITLAAIGAAAILAGCGGGDDSTVQLTGTAYRFNQTKIRIAGATISVAEMPGVTAVTDSKGVYTLTVPAGRPVTPYITAPGYHTIFLQTFNTSSNLVNVNFQTPDVATYANLYLLLTSIGGGVVPDQNGCVIVTTASDAKIQGLSFEDFVAYGAHGVAGATGTTLPTVAPPIYFNANVVPDPNQKTTSKDGGIVWTNVPYGAYSVSATHPTRKFASFTANCEKGRVINANPAWGAYELN
jgi:hypothetical protein